MNKIYDADIQQIIDIEEFQEDIKILSEVEKVIYQHAWNSGRIFTLKERIKEMEHIQKQNGFIVMLIILGLVFAWMRI